MRAHRRDRCDALGGEEVGEAQAGVLASVGD